MPFFGALDSTTASATTISASSVVASPGTFRMGGTDGSTFKSFRWSNQSVSNVNQDTTTVVTVTLSPAMPDANYNVFLDPTVANSFIFSALVDNKTTSSFDMRIRKRGASGNNTVVVDYIVIDF